MAVLTRQPVALFVDQSRQQWIVRDCEGNFWILPPVDAPWEHRQPFYPTEESDLKPIPGHYRDLLGIPF